MFYDANFGRTIKKCHSEGLNKIYLGLYGKWYISVRISDSV